MWDNTRRCSLCLGSAIRWDRWPCATRCDFPLNASSDLSVIFKRTFVTESQDHASAAALSAMKLTQLQAIANQFGLKAISRLRKGELIEAIGAHGQRVAGIEREQQKDPAKAEKQR